jgi:hypothetical protein
MSLDAVEVDLSKAFVYGQGYVALSRVRTLAGLKVLGMSPQALQVDPKVITQDARFRTESDAAEDTFKAMDEMELRSMHERFAVACGGKLPTGEIKPTAVGLAARVKKESTYVETKELLEAGQSLESIAKGRNLAIGTIISHIEKLHELKELDIKLLNNLIEKLPENVVMKVEVLAAILELGPEKLKPLHEATGGKYDYHHIRLVRLLSS